MSKFNELGLSAPIVRAVEEMGFSEPTQIQVEAIPALLNQRDVLGRSNTGTGKTAAFGLPAIDSIDPTQKEAQVLILSPTRELDIQIATELRKFSKYKEGVKIVPIYGGESIDYQIKLIKRGCGIVVGTPGRVMDHLRRKTLKLDNISLVVLDEADEMLNMGFKDDIETILNYMDKDQYQMALFSATMPPAILSITKQFQKDPLMIEIKSERRTVDNIDQCYYECKRGKKIDALRVLLSSMNPELTMIFTNTKKMVEELVDELNKHNIKAIGLHGDMKQQFRSRVMEQYKARNYPILIATDVAARGIDVDDIELVVNFDIPQDNEYYIHRVGRTGRAGKKGKAITLVSGKNQIRFIHDISRYTKSIIPVRPLPSTEQLEADNVLKYMAQVKEACDEQINEQSVEIANALLGEGIAIENILSALISMTYKPVDIDVSTVMETNERKKDRNFYEGETKTLHFNVGRMQKVAASNLVAAISEYSQCPSSIIGKIEINAKYSLVDIQKEFVDKVLEKMDLCTIRGFEVNVKVDEGKGYSIKRGGSDSRGGRSDSRRPRSDSGDGSRRERSSSDRPRSSRSDSSDRPRSTRSDSSDRPRSTRSDSSDKPRSSRSSSEGNSYGGRSRSSSPQTKRRTRSDQ